MEAATRHVRGECTADTACRMGCGGQCCVRKVTKYSTNQHCPGEVPCSCPSSSDPLQQAVGRMVLKVLLSVCCGAADSQAAGSAVHSDRRHAA
jgi:hypothetical protein